MAHSEQPPKGVHWHDLTQFGPLDTLKELTLCLPWLGASFVLYASPLWMIGPFASFMFFLCALRLNHEAIHGNLGLSRGGDSIVMHVLSAIMLGSNHADAFCHLKHHKHNMGEDDVEGRCGHMTFWQVLKYGPRFPVDLNKAAWRSGSRYWRREMVLDWVFVASFVALCLGVGARFLLLHLAAMAIAQCLTALFAVWITHQGTHGSGLAGRSQRGIMAKAAYLMLYHREHHLFPRVPVCHLPALADRLDSQVAGYAQSRQPVVPLWDNAG
ncbi:fatty acid desaturase [Ascidiaceihabitans sp.]|uniref:fatty acid desaturase n=1 Tax=Ascidiaceihabitans sp. TaxID=1872644 RepID=UPI0032972417